MYLLKVTFDLKFPTKEARDHAYEQVSRTVNQYLAGLPQEVERSGYIGKAVEEDGMPREVWETTEPIS